MMDSKEELGQGKISSELTAICKGVVSSFEFRTGCCCEETEAKNHVSH